MSVEAEQPFTDPSRSSLFLYTDKEQREAEMHIGLTCIILQ